MIGQRKTMSRLKERVMHFLRTAKAWFGFAGQIWSFKVL